MGGPDRGLDVDVLGVGLIPGKRASAKGFHARRMLLEGKGDGKKDLPPEPHWLGSTLTSSAGKTCEFC